MHESKSVGAGARASLLQLVLVLTLLLAAFGCSGGGGGDSQNACSDLNLRVSNGDSCAISETPVVLILVAHSDGSISTCTGTFVTVNDVLTAAHCLRSDTIDVAVLTESQTFSVGNGGIIGLGIHPDFASLSGALINDVAMISISQPFGGSPVPLDILTPRTLGLKFTVYGYGLDQAGRDVFERQPDDLLRAGFMQVSQTATGLFTGQFDSTGSSVCPGDSGGPAIHSRDGVAAVLGVTSFGSAECNEGSFAAFTDLTEPTIGSWVKAYAPDVALR